MVLSVEFDGDFVMGEGRGVPIAGSIVDDSDDDDG